jgi:hypothetical protein
LKGLSGHRIYCHVLHKFADNPYLRLLTKNQTFMKVLTHVPGAVLAFLFLFGGINYFIPMAPMPAMTGNPAKFMELFGGTGYMTVIKALEILGGVLIILPTQRAKALLILGPIALNIFFFEIFIHRGVGVGILLVALVGVQAYIDKAKFKALL